MDLRILKFIRTSLSKYELYKNYSLDSLVLTLVMTIESGILGLINFR